MRTACLAVVLVTLVSAPPHALGTSCFEDGTCGVGPGAASILTIAASLVNVGGGISTIGLAVAVGRGDRPAPGWFAAGTLFGTLQLASGVGLMAETEGSNDVLFGYATVTMVAGVTNLALVIAGAVTAPDGDEPLVRVSPLLLHEGGDGCAVGVGVGVFGF